jgi:LmbE family N-acetylglucosaminyl deacetylase
MNPYHTLAAEYARFAREGKSYSLGSFPKCPRPQPAPDAPKALIFSPHPDDEVITGALPLRLLRKSKWNVVNVAVTLGSNRERQPGRLAELRACCDCIGFGLHLTAPNGLERVNLAARSQDPAAWAQSVKVIADLLLEQRPRVILFPHDADWNSTHLGTHFLVLDALRSLPPDFSCQVVETEYWAAMAAPNLMVELTSQDVGDLMTALSYHAGEVRRNPYHLSLPAWMVDNVRRGGELIGGQGGGAPDFAFATLYRLGRWAEGRLERPGAGRWLHCREDPAVLFGL